VYRKETFGLKTALQNMVRRVILPGLSLYQQEEQYALE